MLKADTTSYGLHRNRRREEVGIIAEDLVRNNRPLSSAGDSGSECNYEREP